MSYLRFRAAILSGLLALGVGVAGPVTPAAGADEPFRIYLSPTGSNTNTGLSPEHAVLTLERAEQIVVSSDPATDVEVRIAPGTYRAAKTSWSTYLDDHKISFLPTHYDYSGASTGPRPVFQGPADKEDGAVWFNAAVPGRSTSSTEGLHFYYLEVRHYASGMSIFGSTQVDSATKLRKPGAIRNDHNSLYGMKFQYLGDRYNWNGSALTTGSNAYKGTHAVALTNSSNNDFSNNHFLDLVGIEDPATPYGADAEIIHAFYVKDGSTGNVMQTSDFQRISGAPLKMRNDASGNTVTKNRFYRSGTPSDGIFYDRVERFPCSNPVPAVTTAGCDSTLDSFECPSHGNLFTENARSYLVVDGEKVPEAYDGTRMPTFKRSPYSASQDGKAGCYTGSAPWLTTSGNTWLP